MKLGELGEQYVLKSEKAFASIRFISCEEVSRAVYFLKRKQRDDAARAAFQNLIGRIWMVCSSAILSEEGFCPMIHAYDEQYLDDTMHNLGEAFDFAWNVCWIELDEFLSMMISSGIAELFERGTPKTVSRMSGTELAMEILRKTGMNTANPEVQTDYTCSPEYWTGWILAYFQWYTGRSFHSIREVLSMQEVLRLYPVLHEASEERAVDALNQVIARKNFQTRLQFRRKAAD